MRAQQNQSVHANLDQIRYDYPFGTALCWLRGRWARIVEPWSQTPWPISISLAVTVGASREYNSSVLSLKFGECCVQNSWAHWAVAAVPDLPGVSHSKFLCRTQVSAVGPFQPALAHHQIKPLDNKHHRDRLYIHFNEWLLTVKRSPKVLRKL